MSDIFEYFYERDYWHKVCLIEGARNYFDISKEFAIFCYKLWKKDYVRYGGR